MRRNVAQIALLAALTAVLCAPVRAAEAKRAAWWHKDWQYRLTVRVVPAARRGAINTALLSLAEQSALCAEGGKDIRVVDQRRRVLPHQVTALEDKTLEVKFVVPPNSELFYIYYGNAKASPVSHTWKESLGGLFLETRKLAAATYSAYQIPTRVAQSTVKYDRQPWKQINDSQNPFGPDDMYLSIYDGTIYCPEDGEYIFSLNADDIACFYVVVEGETRTICWRDAGVPSEDWPVPGKTSASSTVSLDRGVYRINYYHIENGGAQLAKLGWQEPSSDAIVTVPVRAFVKYLPAEIEGREQQGQPFNPFFITRHRYNLTVNSGGSVFPFHHLDSRTIAPLAALEGLTFHWQFGDGRTAEGESVDHEFAEMKPYEVTLTVTDAEGKKFVVKRTVTHLPEPSKSMALNMEVEFESKLAVLPAGGSVAARMLLQNHSSVQRDVTLEILAQSADDPKATAKLIGRDVLADLTPSPTGRGNWQTLTRDLKIPEGNLNLTFQLMMHGKAVLEQKLCALSTDRPLGKLTQDSAHNLHDEQGRVVVLRLADVKLAAAPKRALCDVRTGKVKVLVLDEGLGGNAGANQKSSYPALLAEALGKSYKGLTFDVERPAMRRGEEFPFIQRFLERYRLAVAAKPNLVILVCQPESVVNTVPPEAFETYLVASIDQILSQTRAQVVVVTPPPLPGRPELARGYARIAKKTGLRKGVVVADLYSRFMLTADWRDLFKAWEGDQPSYLLYPNRQGQLHVSQEILTSIVAQLHDELSACVRKVSLQGGGE